MDRQTKQHTIFVKVNDEWYPNYEGNMIRVSVLELPQFKPEDPMYVRICAWGADDFGMEKDFRVNSQEEKEEMFKSLVEYSTILKELEPISAWFLELQGWVKA